jgi:two-component system response regulator LytT
VCKAKILVVEDEVLYADKLCSSLLSLGYDVIEPAINYTEAVKKIEQESPDFAILDIQLSGNKTGIDIAKKINADYHFPFVFLSSNVDKETVNLAKSERPSTFLVKPFTKDELFTAIEVALFNYSGKSHQQKENALVLSEYLFVKENKMVHKIYYKDILYIQSDHIYIDLFYTNGKKQTVRGSLNEYIEKLGKSFYRCHRSYIVNIDYLAQFNKTNLTIGNVEIPIGAKQGTELLEKLKRTNS